MSERGRANTLACNACRMQMEIRRRGPEICMNPGLVGDTTGEPFSVSLVRGVGCGPMARAVDGDNQRDTICNTPRSLVTSYRGTDQY